MKIFKKLHFYCLSFLLFSCEAHKYILLARWLWRFFYFLYLCFVFCLLAILLWRCYFDCCLYCYIFLYVLFVFVRTTYFNAHTFFLLAAFCTFLYIFVHFCPFLPICGKVVKCAPTAIEHILRVFTSVLVRRLSWHGLHSYALGTWLHAPRTPVNVSTYHTYMYVCRHGCVYVYVCRYIYSQTIGESSIECDLSMRRKVINKFQV